MASTAIGIAMRGFADTTAVASAPTRHRALSQTATPTPQPSMCTAHTHAEACETTLHDAHPRRDTRVDRAARACSPWHCEASTAAVQAASTQVPMAAVVSTAQNRRVTEPYSVLAWPGLMRRLPPLDGKYRSSNAFLRLSWKRSGTADVSNA